MNFDLALIETFDGGDAQKVGNDLGMVFGIENMIYLGLFGGNIEQSNSNGSSEVVEAQSFFYWGNLLFMKDTPSQQFNSDFERALQKFELSSSGRVLLENAAKSDLEFLSELGGDVDVNITIISDDRFKMEVSVTQVEAQKIVKIINFKKQSDGDFWLFDFNDDFLV